MMQFQVVTPDLMAMVVELASANGVGRAEPGAAPAFVDILQLLQDGWAEAQEAAQQPESEQDSDEPGQKKARGRAWDPHMSAFLAQTFLSTEVLESKSPIAYSEGTAGSLDPMKDKGIQAVLSPDRWATNDAGLLAADMSLQQGPQAITPGEPLLSSAPVPMQAQIYGLEEGPVARGSAGWSRLERFWFLGNEQEEAELASPGQLLAPPVGTGEEVAFDEAAAQPPPPEEVVPPAEPGLKGEQPSADVQKKIKIEPDLFFAAPRSEPTSPGAEEASLPAPPLPPLSEQVRSVIESGLNRLRLARSDSGITVRMQLYPEELGEVLVELKLAGDVLTAHLSSLEPRVAEALRLELPALENTLTDRGFSQVFLGAGTAEQFDQPGHSREGFSEDAPKRGRPSAVVKVENEAVVDSGTTVSDHRLDYRL